MSHRKFEAPRHGNLGFLPRKRTVRKRGRIRTFPKDDKTQKPHLTAFGGYKAGTTHIVRDVNKPGSKINKKEVVEQVTIVETPPLVVVGITGYAQTPLGLRKITSVFAQHLSESFLRRLYKKNNYVKSNKSHFKKHKRYYTKMNRCNARREAYDKLEKLATSIRVICHTQISKLKHLNQKKAHVMEIQINGGSNAEKIAFGRRLFEKYVSISEVFKKDEFIDCVGITKGKGFKGVVSRWGVTKLPRKTHKGLRKVACIGAWHPARVMFQVARAGQKGYFHRHSYNHKIYMIGKDATTEEGKLSGQTEFDLTKKDINPMGGFPNYGLVKEEFVMLKGSLVGPVKRFVALRKTLHPRTSRNATEEIQLKFIDTSSKIGSGKFQTLEEKRKFMGPLKKEKEELRKQELKRLQEERKRKEEEKKKRIESGVTEEKKVKKKKEEKKKKKKLSKRQKKKLKKQKSNKTKE